MLNQSTKIRIFKFPSLVGGMYIYMGALTHSADDLYFFFYSYGRIQTFRWLRNVQTSGDGSRGCTGTTQASIPLLSLVG